MSEGQDRLRMPGGGTCPLSLFLEFSKALRKRHGDRWMTQEDMNELIRCSAALEQAWLAMAPAPKRAAVEADGPAVG